MQSRQAPLTNSRPVAARPQRGAGAIGTVIPSPAVTSRPLPAMRENELPPCPLLSRDTTSTREMELLISGVTVFAPLQLPGMMDQACLGLRPRLDADWGTLSRLLFTCSKMSVLTLTKAFVIHLTMRACWIALVGMNSICPDGVRRDRLKIGTIRHPLLASPSNHDRTSQRCPRHVEAPFDGLGANGQRPCLEEAQRHLYPSNGGLSAIGEADGTRCPRASHSVVDRTTPVE